MSNLKYKCEACGSVIEGENICAVTYRTLGENIPEILRSGDTLHDTLPCRSAYRDHCQKETGMGAQILSITRATLDGIRGANGKVLDKTTLPVGHPDRALVLLDGPGGTKIDSRSAAAWFK